jgi:hypothetical protein
VLTLAVSVVRAHDVVQTLDAEWPTVEEAY